MPVIQRLLTLAAVGLASAGGGAAWAQTPISGYQTPAQQELYNTEPGKPKGTVLDATNPMDLINRLRQATSMSEATDPSDAIDAALKGWETQTPGAAQ